MSKRLASPTLRNLVQECCSKFRQHLCRDHGLAQQSALDQFLGDVLFVEITRVVLGLALWKNGMPFVSQSAAATTCLEGSDSRFATRLEGSPASRIL